MESFQHLYFSESIKKRNYERIRKQLESGNKKMMKDIHPILIRLSGSNLFQYMELKEFMENHQVYDDFYIVGACTSYKEFTVFVEEIMTELLDYNIKINKNDIIDYLKIR